MRSEVDFFVSYASPDVTWAEWIAWQLEASGYATRLQAWDFGAGGNFVADMQRALTRAARTIAVLSPDYLRSDHASAEWFSAYARDPRGEHALLVPVRIADCEIEGLLAQIVWIDLVGLGEEEARERLLDGVAGGRRKPRSAPRFPPLRPSFPPLDRDNPYRGLAAFEADHREDFFGRGRYVEEVCAKLAAHRAVCVLGASGAGKSSLVRAGVLPTLGDAGWSVALCRPRDDPFAGLARGLVPLLEPTLVDPGPIWLAAQRYAERLRRDPSVLGDLLASLTEGGRAEGLLIAVDQFEELFTLVEPDARAAFVRLLAEAPAPSSAAVKWLLVMRGDFLDRALSFETLRGVLDEASVLLGPMSPDELISAIVEPAASRGVRFEPGLPERLCGDVGAADATAGRLPLLQFALTELWLRQDHDVIRHVGYDDPLKGIGGLEGALRRHAERVYGGYAPEDQARIRRLFRRLVERGPGPGDLRRPVPREELAEDWDLVVDLARRRLLGVSETATTVVELIHEALIRAWPDLQVWLEEHREFDLWRQELSAQAVRWETAPDSARPDLLLRGTVLDKAVLRLDERPEDLVPRETAFIGAGVAARRREVRRRMTFVAGAFVLLGAVATFAGVQWLRADAERAVALEQTARAQAREATARAARREAEVARAEAERQARRADREADLAVAQRLAGIARTVLETNAGETATAAMIALQSHTRRSTPEANRVLRDALELTPPEPRVAPVPWSHSDTRISEDGRVQAFFREDALDADVDDVESHATLHLLDGATLASVGRRRDEGSLRSVLSPDGRWLAAGGAARRLRIGDVASGESVLDERYRCSVYPAFGRDGRTLYAARTDGVIEVRSAPEWEITGRLAFPVDGERGAPLIVAPTPDGTHVLIVDRWRAAFAVPVDGGPPLTLAAHDGERGFATGNASTGAVSPTAAVVLVQRSDGKATIRDLSGAARPAAFTESGYARAVVFAPDGATLATASHDGRITLRRTADAAPVHRWERGTAINALAVSPDGRLLASAGEDGSVAIHDTATGATGPRLEHSGEALALAFDPTDGTLLSGDSDGTLGRFDPETGAVLASRELSGRVSAIVAGGAGGRIAVSVQDGRARSRWDEALFFDRASGRERAHLVRNADFQAQALGPDGRRFATWDRRRETITLWDTATAEPLLTVPDITLGEYRFSPDGERLLVRSARGPLRVIDARSGETLHDLGEPGGVTDVAASADADRLVTLGGDGTIRRWNLQGGTGAETVAVDGDAYLGESGTRYAVRAADGESVEVRDLRGGEPVATLSTAGWIHALFAGDTRLVTVERISEPESGRLVANEVVLWDVDRGRALRTLRWESSALAVDTLPSGHVVLRGPLYRERLSRVEIVDASDGRTRWFEEIEGGGFLTLFPVAGDPGSVLLDTGRERQYRGLVDGSVRWRIPGGGTRAVTAIPGSGRIALANAVSMNNEEDAVLILDRANGAERHRIAEIGPVRALHASADGARIVAAVQSGTFHGLRVWDADGVLLRDIALDAAPRQLIALGEAGHLAVHDFSGKLRVFDPANGELLHRLSHSPQVDHAAFASGADRAITWSGASLRHWDTRSGRELARRVVDGPIVHAAIDPDGRRIAYLVERPRTTDDGAEFRVVEIWTPETGRAPTALAVERVIDLRFDRTGSRLLILRRRASGAGRNVTDLRVIDARTLQTLGVVEPLHDGELADAEVTGDGTTLLVRETGRYGERGRTVRRHSLRAFDLSSFEELSRVDFDGGDAHVSPLGSEVTLRIDGKWRSFDPGEASVDEVLGSGVQDAQLETASGSSRLLTWGYRDGARAFDLRSGESVPLADGANGEDRLAVLDAALSPDGRFAALALRDEASETSPGVILVLDAESGRELARARDERPVRQLAFAADGATLILGETQRGGIPTEADSRLMLWPWRERAPRSIERRGPVRGLAIGPVDGLFATLEGYVDALSDVTLGERRLALRAADGSLLAETPLDFDAHRAAFSPDGRYLAVSGPGAARLFAVGDLKPLHAIAYSGTRTTSIDLRTQDEAVVSGAPSIGFLEGGEVLAAGTASGAILRRIDTGETRRLHEGAKVTEIATSPDGSLLVLRGDDFVSVRDAATRERLVSFPIPASSRLAFGGVDGTELYALEAGRLRRLTWSPRELTARACARFADRPWQDGAERLLGEPAGSPCTTLPRGE